MIVFGDWTTAASALFLGDVTIAGGESKFGGGTGQKRVELWVGDGLSSGGGGYVDNRIYLRFFYTHAGNDWFSQIRITRLNWKLARV